MFLLVLLLGSVNISHSMDKKMQPADKGAQSDANRVTRNNECTGCYFGPAVPACPSCVTKRNSSDRTSTTPQANVKAAVVPAKNDLSKSQEVLRCP